MTAAVAPVLGAAPAAQAKGMRLGVITAIGKDPNPGIKRVKDLGFPSCQLYAGSSAGPELAKLTRAAIERYGIEITALIATGPAPEVYDFYRGPETIGVVPRQYRAARIAVIKKASDFAKMCGIPAVQTHCGFIPENPNDPLYKEAVAAIREVAQYCKQNGQNFRCETGQETPITLVRAIRDAGVDSLGVNLDPANLILYGTDQPIPALKQVGRYVKSVHCKDAKRQEGVGGGWAGVETPLGQGDVNIPLFLRTLNDLGYDGPLTIEREISGEQQKKDIAEAIGLLKRLRSEILG